MTNPNIPPQTVAPLDQTEIASLSQELVEQSRTAIYKELHENWRQDVRQDFEDKGQSPDTARLRASKDKTGIQDADWFRQKEAEGIVFEQDETGDRLVNTNVPFEDLPLSWQEANKSGGDFVINGVVAAIESGRDVTTDEYVEEESARVHVNWMNNNSWMADDRPDLFVPYGELTEEEKKKDRDQVLIAVAKLTGRV